jgi:hypothetical protein
MALRFSIKENKFNYYNGTDINGSNLRNPGKLDK